MSTASPPMPAPLPEWRRSGPFLVIALLLHGAVLAAYPLREALLTLPSVTDGVLSVQLRPPVAPALAPASTPAPRPIPTAHTPAKPVPASHIEHRQLSGTMPAVHSAPVAAVTPTAIETAATRFSPPAGGNESAPARPADPVRTAARFDAAYLQNPHPDYPSLSRRLGEEGKVLLKVRVSPDGRPLAVDLERSSEFSRLDAAAVDVVRRWRFVPARLGDEAIEASVIVPIVFRLQG